MTAPTVYKCLCQSCFRAFRDDLSVFALDPSGCFEACPSCGEQVCDCPACASTAGALALGLRRLELFRVVDGKHDSKLFAFDWSPEAGMTNRHEPEEWGVRG